MDNSFLWCSHHVRVTPFLRRRPEQGIPYLCATTCSCMLRVDIFTGPWWVGEKMEASRPLSIDSAYVTALSHLPSTLLARVCSLPSGGAEGYRSRPKFSMICSVTCSVIVIITSYLVSSIDVLFWVSFIPLVICKKAL